MEKYHFYKSPNSIEYSFDDFYDIILNDKQSFQYMNRGINDIHYYSVDERYCYTKSVYDGYYKLIGKKSKNDFFKDKMKTNLIRLSKEQLLEELKNEYQLIKKHMFKVGDKVVFVDDKDINDKPTELILYRVYNVSGVYNVSNVSNMNRKLFEIDEFPEWVFPVKRFISLSEFRKEKIKRIKNGKI